MLKLGVALLSALLLCVASAPRGGGASPQNANSSASARRGLYAIWYGKTEELLKLPYIKGGQIVEQWADVEPKEGGYDFSRINDQLRRFQERGQFTTIQINGNRKPAWLFLKAPHSSEKLSIQVADREGTLMYWHPAHRQAYLNLLAAFGRFLETASYRGAILGVRLNFNAIGTEHINVPAPYRAPGRWTTPQGVTPGEPWTAEAGMQYKQEVVRTFVRRIAPRTHVFVRNNIEDEIRGELQPQFESGKLGWFHTSTEVEPRGAGTVKQYQTFLDYARTGKTDAYAESWADAWGYHGGIRDARWCSPPQWNYWRLLADLHCGVSYIAVYGADLSVAASGRHPKEEAGAYQEEFQRAFEFAARYAGRQASPAASPGAWVALREGNFLKGDYDFLMTRLPDASTELRNIGPETQRYGAWARQLPKGSKMRLALDDGFARSLAGAKPELHVTYLDRGRGSLTVAAAGRSFSLKLRDTNRWQTAGWPLDRASLRKDAGGAHISLGSDDADVVLHMIEVARGAGASNAKAVRASR